MYMVDQLHLNKDQRYFPLFNISLFQPSNNPPLAQLLMKKLAVSC